MNVYRLIYDHASMPSTLSAIVAAESIAHAVTADLGAIGAINSVEFLGGLIMADAVPSVPEVVRPSAAEIKASVTPDFITSFEDGKLYRTLKRHVAKHGMTLAEYRTKWGLPSDYPSVAPGYSVKRSELAKAAGLGRK